MLMIPFFVVVFQLWCSHCPSRLLLTTEDGALGPWHFRRKGYLSPAMAKLNSRWNVSHTFRVLYTDNEPYILMRPFHFSGRILHVTSRTHHLPLRKTSSSSSEKSTITWVKMWPWGALMFSPLGPGSGLWSRLVPEKLAYYSSHLTSTNTSHDIFSAGSESRRYSKPGEKPCSARVRGERTHHYCWWQMDHL